MITPEMKDKVLSYLCEHCPLERAYQLEYEELSEFTSKEELKAILLQFARMNILPKLDYWGDTYIIVLQADAHDLLARGGFVAEQFLFTTELEKIQAELKKLQADANKPELSRADKVAILSNIISFAGSITAFLGGK